jgi:large subunit ribosomal protein L18
MKGKLTRILGSKERPRLRVSVTLKHIYAQIIDDEQGRTIVSSSTVEKALKAKKLKPSIESAKKIGEVLGKKAVEKGVTLVVFDRGEKRYHGKVKALADAARGAGLKF